MKTEYQDARKPSLAAGVSFVGIRPGKYVAFSVNKTSSRFIPIAGTACPRVYDLESDVVVYDVEKHARL